MESYEKSITLFRVIDVSFLKKFMNCVLYFTTRQRNVQELPASDLGLLK